MSISKFNKQIEAVITNLAGLGYTDVQLSGIIGVTEKTLNNWKHKHPNFFQSLKEAKSKVDSEVEASLLKRAKGYTEIENRAFVNKAGNLIKYQNQKCYPPSEVACIFWLKNRQPEKWRDKVEGDFTHTLKDYDKYSNDQLIKANREAGFGLPLEVTRRIATEN